MRRAGWHGSGAAESDSGLALRFTSTARAVTVTVPRWVPSNSVTKMDYYDDFYSDCASDRDWHRGTAVRPAGVPSSGPPPPGAAAGGPRGRRAEGLRPP